MQFIQSLKIDVSFVNNVKAPCFKRDEIQNIKVVNTDSSDVQNTMNGGLYIVKGMKFNFSFMLPEFSPPEDT